MLMVLQECLRIPYPGWPHTRLETIALSSSCCPVSEGKPEKSRRRRKDVNDIIFRIDFPRENFLRAEQAPRDAAMLDYGFMKRKKENDYEILLEKSHKEQSRF